MICTALVSSQEKARPAWKEYVYADDGFAITVPSAPDRHPDTGIPDMTAYSIDLQTRSRLTLRVGHQVRDCASTLGQLKEGALAGKDGTDVSSVKDVSIDGYSGLEYEVKLGPELMTFHRFYCVDGKFYTFSAGWPVNQQRPASVNRVLNSFRLLKREQK